MNLLHYPSIRAGKKSLYIKAIEYAVKELNIRGKPNFILTNICPTKYGQKDKVRGIHIGEDIWIFEKPHRNVGGAASEITSLFHELTHYKQREVAISASRVSEFTFHDPDSTFVDYWFDGREVEARDNSLRLIQGFVHTLGKVHQKYISQCDVDCVLRDYDNMNNIVVQHYNEL